MDPWKLVLVELEVKYTCIYIYINTEKRQGLWGTPSNSSIFNDYTRSIFELNRGRSPGNPDDLSKKSTADWQRPAASLKNQMPNIPNMNIDTTEGRRTTLNTTNLSGSFPMRGLAKMAVIGIMEARRY